MEIFQRLQSSRIRGMIYLAVSALFFSTVSFSAKVLVANWQIPVYEVILTRSVIQVIGSVIGISSMRYFDPKEKSKNITEAYFGKLEARKKCIIRGLTGFGALSLFYFSLKYLSLADASTLLFTSPITTAILAKITMNEPFERIQRISALITISGAVLVTRPHFLFGGDSGTNSDPWEHLVGSVMALSASIFTSLSYILIRSAGENVNPFVISGYFGFICVLLSAPILIITRSFDSGYSHPRLWAYLILAGMCAVGGQVLLNMGLALERAGSAAMLRNLDVVFAFIIDTVILKQDPPALSIFGACLVCGGVIIIGVFKDQEQRNPQLPPTQGHVFEDAEVETVDAKISTIQAADKELNTTEKH
jgi:drug/metabolite transporter (DMT)-like permease